MATGLNLEITKDDVDGILGHIKGRAFRLDEDREEISFFKTDYTWDQIIAIADWIKEERELHDELEETPF